MPSIGEVAGFVIYIYWPDHSKEHVHLRKAGREVSVALDGAVLAGTLSAAELHEVAAWVLPRREKIAQAISELKQGRRPQWID